MQDFDRGVFIQVAEDCPAEQGLVPPQRAKPSLAQCQHELLLRYPYRFNSHELVVAMRLLQEGVPEACWGEAMAPRMHEIFAKPQPCLRVSPLAKQYGWGLHLDAEGRVAMVGRETEAYRGWVEAGQQGQLRLTRAMRTGRTR